nr:MAG TPA: Late nodulin protein [Crassvirales sp.]
MYLCLFFYKIIIWFTIGFIIIINNTKNNNCKTNYNCY